MSRPLAVLYILFCFEIGICLVVFPWMTKVWSGNFFVDHYPWVSSLARNYFVRGAVSGIGIADMWLAFYELRHFPRKPRAAGK
jgi:hypothetical protein